MLQLDYADRQSTVVWVASDHGGFEAKSFASEHIRLLGYTVNDLGAYSDESVDYPDFARLAAEKVLADSRHCGVIFCGTGIGISIAANRFKGIRAALCTSVTHAEMARKHNNANIIAMGGRISSKEDIAKMLDLWFVTPFEGGRHIRRIEKIDQEV
jgi:ribose 5-phosphate isomerase B